MAPAQAAAAQARIRVVVVNYNSAGWLQRCVAGLQRSIEPWVLTVVDNASDDASADYCRQLAESGVGQVVFNSANRGFASACNQAGLTSAEPYLCFLNPDCELESAALGHLRQALETHPDAALAGALILNTNGTLQRASLRHLPSPGRALVTALGLERLGFGGVNIRSEPPSEVTRVSAVSGAVMLLRADRFAAAGGFDEDYFLHCEDLDLFVRLQAAGGHILLVPEARAVHGLGVSQRRRPLFAQRCKHRSLARYFGRHVAGSRFTGLLWSAAIWLHFLVTAPLVALRRRS